MRKILLILIAIVSILGVTAQRKVTPIENKKSSLQTIEGKQAAKKLLEKKIEPSLVFGDSIINVDEETKPDTVGKPKMIFPLMQGLSIGVNILDPIMMIFGQSYGSIDFSAELSLHNRFIPAIEIGIGRANNTPEDGNYTYKTPLSFYGKIGASYNFLYNKTPDYQLTAGFRVGFSSFKYDITNITVNSGYWDETKKVEILDQKSNACWAELLLALKVKIYRNIAMGWSFRYRLMMSYKKNENSDPWYIPGFGSRTNGAGATYSIYYTLPLNRKGKVSDKVDAVNKELNKLPFDSKTE
ncbi:MAG: DUF6048 family protein [Muribaculaceae bacterium]|nr:DUF6048 family protein [Muribaculaceae bacterium]